VSARFEINCDGRSCSEHKVVVVRESILSEANKAIADLRTAGWRFTLSARSKSIVCLCPKHADGRRR
jgi:hypothetical protein